MIIVSLLPQLLSIQFVPSINLFLLFSLLLYLCEILSKEEYETPGAELVSSNL